jgi:transcriptional regulator of arginine metabolism
MNSEKQHRHRAIRELLERNTVSNQSQLRSELKKQGIAVTQATLSRDIKELGIARTHIASGEARYEISQVATPLAHMQPYVGYEIVEIVTNNHLVIVKTLPGHAQSVAETIDGLKHPHILATLAGDNTIFIAPSAASRSKQVMRSLRTILIDGKSKASA